MQSWSFQTPHCWLLHTRVPLHTQILPKGACDPLQNCMRAGWSSCCMCAPPPARLQASRTACVRAGTACPQSDAEDTGGLFWVRVQAPLRQPEQPSCSYSTPYTNTTCSSTRHREHLCQAAVADLRALVILLDRHVQAADALAVRTAVAARLLNLRRGSMELGSLPREARALMRAAMQESSCLCPRMQHSLQQTGHMQITTSLSSFHSFNWPCDAM